MLRLPGPPTSASFTIANPYNEGTTYALNCDVIGGNPTPTVAWYINGIQVATNANPYSYSPSRNEDTQQIYCEATNTRGTVSSTPKTLDVDCECEL